MVGVKYFICRTRGSTHGSATKTALINPLWVDFGFQHPHVVLAHTVEKQVNTISNEHNLTIHTHSTPRKDEVHTISNSTYWNVHVQPSTSTPMPGILVHTTHTPVRT